LSVARAVDPDPEAETWSVWTGWTKVSCGGSSPVEKVWDRLIAGVDSPSPLWGGEEEAGAMGGELGWAENTK
jgi:hypothetical protein